MKKFLFLIFLFFINYFALMPILYFVSFLLFKEKIIVKYSPISEFQRHYYFNGGRKIWNGLPGCSIQNFRTIYEPAYGNCKHSNIEYEVEYNFDNLGRHVPEREKKFKKFLFEKEKSERETEGGGVAIIGDSVAMGFGVNDEQVYSNIIQKEIDIPVFNLAVESFATERELLRLYNSDIKNKVKIIIINYHGNDLGENKLKLDSEYYYNESVKWANQGSTIPKTLGYRQALRDLLLKFKFSLLTPPKLLINYFFQKKLDPLLNNFDEDFTEHKFYLKKVLQNHNDYLKDKYIIILYSNEWGNRFDNYPSGFDSELKNVLFFDVNLTRNDFYFLDDHPNKNGHYSIGKKLSLLINTFNEIK